MLRDFRRSRATKQSSVCKYCGLTRKSRLRVTQRHRTRSSIKCVHVFRKGFEAEYGAEVESRVPSITSVFPTVQAVNSQSARDEHIRAAGTTQRPDRRHSLPRKEINTHCGGNLCLVLIFLVGDVGEPCCKDSALTGMDEVHGRKPQA